MIRQLHLRGMLFMKISKHCFISHSLQHKLVDRARTVASVSNSSSCLLSRTQRAIRQYVIEPWKNHSPYFPFSSSFQPNQPGQIFASANLRPGFIWRHRFLRTNFRYWEYTSLHFQLSEREREPRSGWRVNHRIVIEFHWWSWVDYRQNRVQRQKSQVLDEFRGPVSDTTQVGEPGKTYTLLQMYLNGFLSIVLRIFFSRPISLLAG